MARALKLSTRLTITARIARVANLLCVSFVHPPFLFLFAACLSVESCARYLHHAATRFFCSGKIERAFESISCRFPQTGSVGINGRVREKTTRLQKKTRVLQLKQRAGKRDALNARLPSSRCKNGQFPGSGATRLTCWNEAERNNLCLDAAFVSDAFGRKLTTRHERHPGAVSVSQYAVRLVLCIPIQACDLAIVRDAIEDRTGGSGNIHLKKVPGA